MDNNIEPQMDSEDVRIDDNVDQLFEQKMKKLRELGLYDDRMMDKVNLIKNMDANPGTSVPKNYLARGFQVLGRPDYVEANELVEFEGDKESEEGGFKPINSGLKWSLPISKKPKRNRSRSPQRDRGYEPNRNRSQGPQRDRNYDRDRDRDHRERGRYRDRECDTKPQTWFKSESTNDSNSLSNEAIDRKYTYDCDPYQPSTSDRGDNNIKEEPKTRFKAEPPKSSNFNDFFDKKRLKPEEKKTETITDIEAFIRDCNKKAEKPKPLIFDDIDDFIEKANQRFNEISANLDKTYSS